jgi:hypothetical protein
MSFDIEALHFPDNTPEAMAVEQLMHAENLTAEEAVRTILKNAHMPSGERNFILEGKGLFRAPADAQLIDEAVSIALAERRRSPE